MNTKQPKNSTPNSRRKRNERNMDIIFSNSEDNIIASLYDLFLCRYNKLSHPFWCTYHNNKYRISLYGGNEMKNLLLILLILFVGVGCQNTESVKEYNDSSVAVIVENAYLHGLSRGMNVCVEIQTTGTHTKKPSEYYSIDSVEMFKLYGLNK